MTKLTLVLFFSSALLTATHSSLEPHEILDSKGRLILQQGEEIASMKGQCKSLRISKNPPLVPRLKCRFS